jgi:hypothetical protein
MRTSVTVRENLLALAQPDFIQIYFTSSNLHLLLSDFIHSSTICLLLNRVH